MENIVIKITGMSCEHCVNAVKGAVMALDGVVSAVVDLDGGTASLEFDASKVTLAGIKAAIEEEGYEADI